LITKQAYKKHKQIIDWWADKNERQVWEKYDYVVDITNYWEELQKYTTNLKQELDKLDLNIVETTIDVGIINMPFPCTSTVPDKVELLGTKSNLGKFLRQNNLSLTIQEETNWILTDNPSWKVDNTYVENDIFSEIRKGYFNGDLIEYFDKEHQQWYPLEQSKNSLDLRYEVSYRNASKCFNVGEVVIYKDLLYRITKKESYYAYIESDKSKDKVMMFKLSKWKPVIGEKYLFWNEGEKTKIIGRLADIMMVDYINPVYTVQDSNPRFKKTYTNILPLSLINTNDL